MANIENMTFVDRVSKYPNRIKLEIVNQSADKIVADMQLADEPTVEGTPLNAEILNQFKTKYEEANNKADNAVNNVVTLSNQIIQEVEIAKSTATQAVSIANSANQKATTIETTAEKAKTKSELAMGQSTLANEKSETAKTIAETAEIKAQEALIKSNDALQAVEANQGTAVYQNGEYTTQFNADEKVDVTLFNEQITSLSTTKADNSTMNTELTAMKSRTTSLENNPINTQISYENDTFSTTKNIQASNFYVTGNFYIS